MSSSEELGRIAEEAKVIRANREHQQYQAQEALRRATAEKAAKESSKRLGKFAREVAKSLARQTTDSALEELAWQGYRSAFIPAHPTGRGAYNSSPGYVSPVASEIEARAQALRDRGYNADAQVRQLPTKAGWYPEDAGGTPDYYENEDWVGVEVRW